MCEVYTHTALVSYQLYSPLLLIGYLSEAMCKWFAYGPSDATATCHLLITCFIKIQNGSAFLMPVYPCCPGKKPLNGGGGRCCSLDMEDRYLLLICYTMYTCCNSFLFPMNPICDEHLRPFLYILCRFKKCE